MYRIGLTGGIGSGKTEVASMLRDLGATVVAADDLARELVRPGTRVLREIATAFGPGVLNEDGTLDRGALAEIVFLDPARLAALNRIVHPPLVDAILGVVEALERDGRPGPLVVDAALLLEWDIADSFDLIVVVRAPLERRLRWLEADGLSRAQAQARIGSQRDDEDFAEAADVVIDNCASLEELRARVMELWAMVQRQSRGEEP